MTDSYVLYVDVPVHCCFKYISLWPDLRALYLIMMFDGYLMLDSCQVSLIYNIDLCLVVIRTHQFISYLMSDDVPFFVVAIQCSLFVSTLQCSLFCVANIQKRSG